MSYLDEGRSYILGTGSIHVLNEGSVTRKTKPKFPIGFRVTEAKVEGKTTKKPKLDAKVSRLSKPKKGA